MKQQYLALLIAMSMLAGYNTSTAQFNSAAHVDAGGDRKLCGTSCFDLTAHLTDIRSTDNYLVDSSIDFNSHYPFYIPGSNSIHAENNIFSESLPLSFNFCFYGKVYNRVAIGSNGIISFDEESAGKRCDPITKKEIPNRTYAYAAIMPAYEALDISLGGSIYYSTEGNAPNRKFIVNYNNIPLKTCSIDNVTFQVVLYETTNVIELYLKDKPSCLYYYDGAAIAGIQNSSKEAIALPGKNASRWGSMGMNAAYRFIPWGDAASQIVQLSEINGKVISSVQASTSENGQLSASFGKMCIEGAGTQYIVSTTYNSCNMQNICSDTINVTRNGDCGSTEKPAPVALTERHTMVKAASSTASEATHWVSPDHELVVHHVSTSNPTMCLGINGSINLHGLLPNTEYSVTYSKNGAGQKAVKIYSNAAGAVIISKLSAGTYSNIKVQLNGTSSTEPGPYVLTDPESPATPEASSNSPINPGEKLSLSASSEGGVSYTWLGPGFASVNTSREIAIMNAQPYNSGAYSVIATKNGCNSLPARVVAVVNNNKGGIPDRTVPVRFNNNPKHFTAPVRTNPAIAVKHKNVVIKHVAVAQSKPVTTVAKQKIAQVKPAKAAKTNTVAAVKQKPRAEKKPDIAKTHPVKVYASSNSPVKAGGTLRLHSTATDGSTYSWNGPNNFSSNAQNPALNNVSSAASGIYTLTVSSPLGVLKTTQVNVNVLAAAKEIAKVKEIKEEPVTENIVASAIDPYVKYGSDGAIKLSGLLPSTTYKVYYTKEGQAQTMKYFTSDASGVLLIMWLSAGNYNNVYVASLKGGRSNSISISLTNPGQTKVYLPPVAKPANKTYKAEDIHPSKPASTVNPQAVKNSKPAVKTSTVHKETKAGPKAIAVSKPVVKPLPTPQPIAKPEEMAEDIEYKGIILSNDNAFLDETITVNYTDPVKKNAKIKWDFGDATVVSGKGTGPYVLRWRNPGMKTVSLTLPYNIPNFGSRLQKDIYIHERPAPEEVIAPPQQELISQESIKARHEAEEQTVAVTETTQATIDPSTTSAQMPTEHIKKYVPPVVPPVTDENIVASRTNVCLNDTATISFDGYVPDEAELNWDFDDATIVSGKGAGPYVVRWDENGNKSIKLSVSNGGEKKTLTQTLYVKPAPKADFLLQADACPGENVSVEINRDKDRSETHSWDFDGADVMSGDDGGPYEIKWEEPGKKVVSLTVVDAGGCTSLPYREIITVHNDCCGMSLPSAFTPNGDGKNDVFRVVSVGPHAILRFVIYNRFGREIFSTNNEGEGWDGTLNGTPQEIGTYTYKVRYRCGEKLYEKEGEVMLLR